VAVFVFVPALAVAVDVAVREQLLELRTASVDSALAAWGSATRALTTGRNR